MNRFNFELVACEIYLIVGEQSATEQAPLCIETM